jgi:capsule polysaccharide export protein KpsE/RkpR
MSGPGFKQDPETWSFQLSEPPVHEQGNGTGPGRRERQAEIVRTLWDRRRSLLHAAIVGLVLSTLLAFLLPKSYTSTAQLMPPDPQSGNGLAMMAALAGKTLGNLSGMTGDLLGLKSSGAMFVGVLKSETSQDRIVQQFDLKKVYGKRYVIDARKKLDDSTAITEDRKSGIITIKVSDRDPQRAAAIANAYVDELNDLVAQLSTSAAHRERVFLEQRLKLAKVDLDTAADQLAQFSSKNNTLDVQIEGKAMLDAAGNLAGQLIAAESQLEGLRQIYTDNNARVKALKARVDQLRNELEKFGGSKQNPEVDAPNATNPGLLQTGDPPSQGQPGGSQPFPSIRNLPLLGAKYTDYYRRVKIQEAVFELLTEQFELAKVQEAKETPSVKLLDPGKVPEKKSFPPRLLVMTLGTFLVFAGAMVWITAGKHWNDVDPNDPRKILAMEMSAAVRASAPWTAHNGDAHDLWPRRIWNRMTNHQDPPNGEL